MTTAVDVTVARRVEVRAVFSYLGELDVAGNSYPFTIVDAVGHLRGIENLLFLCSVSDWDATRSESGETFASPATFISNVNVRRLLYASPLEVVTWFFAGTAAATTATNQLIKVWTNWQFARRTKAGTDLFIAAADVLQASINAPIPLDPSNTGYDRFELAARTLAMLGDLEINEET